MSHFDDLLGIAAIATLSWAAAFVAQPPLPADVAAIASRTAAALAGASATDSPALPPRKPGCG